MLMEVDRYLEAVTKRNRCTVVELYSPPRVTKECYRFGMQAGIAFDLTEVDPDTGRAWDLSKPQIQDKVLNYIKETKPMLVVGSLMCAAFSVLQRLNYPKMAPEVVGELLRRGVGHLRFCAKVYRLQAENNKYFVHEHPWWATSWDQRCMKAVTEMKDVVVVKADMCQFGMMGKDKEGWGYHKKPTGFATNSKEIAKKLRRECKQVGAGHGEHRHIPIFGWGRSVKASVYPQELCTAILEGLRNQLAVDDNIIMELGVQEPEEEDINEDMVRCWDDVSGAELRPNLVMKARAEELEHIKKHQVYDKVAESECWRNTGAGPIKTKWLDVNKGDEKAPEYRSRWVAMEIAVEARDDVFAATPPLQLKKYLFSRAVSGMARSGKPRKLIFIDIKRAFFHAPVQQLIYVKLPPEDDTPGMVGRLNASLYGTRAAARNWQKHVGQVMHELGYKAAVSNPCLFRNGIDDVEVVVHGDDFTGVGDEDGLRKLEKGLKAKLELKVRGLLGPEAGDMKTIRILNRVLTWTSEGLEYESDQRHAELVLRALNLEEANAVNSPCDRGLLRRVMEGEEAEELEMAEASKFRAVAARINYMCSDRCDLQFACKEACRWMSCPTRGSRLLLKRIGRYLRGKPRAVQHFKYQAEPTQLTVYVDADWAGCLRTRRSTVGGGAVLHGGHMLRSWASTLATVCTSSGESEYGAAVKGASIGLGIQSMITEMGRELQLVLACDSSAALGVAQRQGLGKLRHLDVALLWLQGFVEKGKIQMKKIGGTSNPADLFTKLLAGPAVEHWTKVLGYEFRDGRAELAPEVT